MDLLQNNYTDDSNQRKRLALTGLALFGVLILGLIVYGVFFYQAPNPYGDRLEIKNLSSYTKNHPVNRDSQQFIEHQLFLTVNLNTQPAVKNNSVKDIVVRADTYFQTEDDGLHTVSFLVDSERLQQSYRVSYQWTDKPYIPVEETGTGVKCIKETNLLLYGSFNCVDLFEDYSKSVDEKLAQILPYDAPYYSISYSRDDDISTISVKIMSNNNSTSTRKFYQQYKKAAGEWMKSKGLNLNDYNLIYRNFSGDVVSSQDKKT